MHKFYFLQKTISHQGHPNTARKRERERERERERAGELTPTETFVLSLILTVTDG